ncbi:hypothetical protein JD844_030984, partial [Phrynosoma platyrhinos]
MKLALVGVHSFLLSVSHLESLPAVFLCQPKMAKEERNCPNPICNFLQIRTTLSTLPFANVCSLTPPPDQSSLKIIMEAFEDFARLTCIRFVPYSYQRDFVSIVPLSGLVMSWRMDLVGERIGGKVYSKGWEVRICFSSVGRIGGMQVVSLAPACLRKGKGVALHEFMHVLGFWHEHSRADRDKYISISWNEILTGFEMNFLKSWNTNMLGDYDYSSVMHYGRHLIVKEAFPIQGLFSAMADADWHVVSDFWWHYIQLITSLALAKSGTLHNDQDPSRVTFYSTGDLILQPNHFSAPFRNAFSMTGLPTITPLSNLDVYLGQRWNLSKSDIARVNKLYKCSQVAAQPETSAGRVVKEKMMDFIPSEPQPCSNESQVETSTAWSHYSKASARETLGATVSSSRTVGQGIIALETEMQRAWPSGAEMQNQSTVSPETSSKAEERGEFLGATAEMLHTNRSREMEPTKVVSPAQKTSVPSALQNHTSSARELRRQPPSYKETYPPKEQEGRTRTTLETVFPLSFLTKGPVPFPTEMVQEATVRADTELFEMTEVAHRKHTADLSTAMGMRSTQSGESGHVNGSPRPTEISSFSVVEKQPMFHQTISILGNKNSSPTSMSLLMGNVGTEVTSTSYRMLSPKSPVSASSFGGLGEEEALGTESESPASSASMPNQSGMVGQKVKGFQSKEQSALTYLWSTTSRKEYGGNKLEHSEFPSEETLSPGSIEAQETHLGWATAGTSSFPWSAVTGQLAPSRLKEETISGSRSTELSTVMEPFSYPSAHLTQSEIGAEELTPAHPEWSSQASTSWKMGSLAMESNQATHPAERSALSTTSGQRPKASWSQPSHTKGYGLSVLTAGQAPSAVVQEEKSESSLETVSVTTIGRLTMGQKIGLSHGTGAPREAKAHGRSTLWRLFSAETFTKQMPIQPGQQLAGTQWQPSPTPPIETAIPGEGKVQIQTRNPNRQETKVTLRLCGGNLSGSLSERKPSPMEQTSKSGVSPDMGLKLGPTGGGSPGLETKENGSPLEGMSPPAGEMSTTLSWVSVSSNAQERNKMGNHTDLDKEEPLSARMSTLPHKRTPEDPETHSQGTAPARSVGTSHFASVMVFSKPTLKRPQSSSPSWETGSVMNTDSPSPQSLEPATKSHIASHFNDVISSTRYTVNATDETVLQKINWVSTLSQEVRNGQSGAQSPALGVQPTTLPRVSTEGKALLLTTGSLESPKPINYQEGSTGSHPPKESLPATEKAFAEGTAMAFLTHLPLESWESQTVPLFGSQKATSKRWGDMAMEADASRETSTEPQRMPFAKSSSLGSLEEHIVVTTSPELQPDLQSDMEYLEETTWQTSGPKVTKVLVEEKGKILTHTNGIYLPENTTIAMYTGTGPVAVTTSISGRPPSPLTYSSSTEDTEESATIYGKKKSMPSSADTISNLQSGSSVPSHPLYGETETSFLLNAQNSLGAEKMETTVPMNMSSGDIVFAAKVAVTPGISQVHPQTLGPTEHGIWSKFSMLNASQHKEVYGHHGFPLAKRIWLGMGNKGLLHPSAEPSKQAAETQIAVKLETGTRNDLKERKPEQSRNRPVDKPGYLHHVAKRSLIETMISNPGHHTLRKLMGRPAFPKEHMHRKLLAVLTRITHHTLAPGLFKVHLGSAIEGQKDGAFSVENQMKEPAETTGLSTLRSKTLAHFQNLPSLAKQARNNQMANQRTMEVEQPFFCSFEKDLCSWEQSKGDDLDWVLEKEEEFSVASVEDKSAPGLPCRTSGSHLSLKPSSLVPHQKAILRSPIMSSITCLKFWYKGMDSSLAPLFFFFFGWDGLGLGQINFYLKHLNSSKLHPVWSMKGRRDISWHQVTVPISKTGEVQ